MDQGAHHRVQDTGDSQGDGDEVQGHGEGQIALDGAHHPLGECQQMGQLPDVVVYQGDVRGVHSDVAAHAAHGNAHMGPLQGRSVVDAVPHHADQMAALLAAVDPG